MFKFVCRGLGKQLPTTFYEPFLWDVSFESYSKGGAFQTTDNISHSGIAAHVATPLSPAPGSNQPEFNRFLDPILGGPCVVKFIRANARLDYIMTRHPDTVLIGILRNPISTLNSAIYQFSFFGEEYHRSDWPRFQQEFSLAWPPLLQSFISSQADDQKTYGLAQLAWWYAMNNSLVSIHRKYPQRSFLTTQEALDEKPDVVCKEMASKLGITDFHLPSSQTGSKREPHTKQNHLTGEEFTAASDLLDTYFRFRENCDVPGWKSEDDLRSMLQQAHHSEPASVDRAEETSNLGFQPVRLRAEASRLKGVIHELRERVATSKKESRALANELKHRNSVLEERTQELQEARALLEQNILWRLAKRIKRHMPSK